MADDANNIDSLEDAMKLTRNQRYYALHREEKLKKVKERYQNCPEFIAKREEQERKKTEKEAEKELKRIEKERIRLEKLALALATKHPKMPKSKTV